MAKQLQIKQVRSEIGAKPRQRATLLALGLRGVNRTVTQQDSPAVRGMIETVKHMVTVQDAG